MDFTFTELAVLVGLADGKTLSEIASQLYIGQPGVSKALQAATTRSGIHLVDREGYRVRLTAAGAEIAARSRLVLDQAEGLDQFVGRLREGEAGPIRLMSTSTPGNSILPDIVGAFSRQHPEAEVELRIAQRSQIWERCVHEGYDLAVGPLNRSSQALVGRDWTLETLYEDRITFFVGSNHRLTGRTVSLHELEGEKIIGPFAEPYWTDAWDQLSDLGFSSRRRMTLLSAEAVKRLVKAGGGVGMLLGLSILGEVKAGELEALHLETMPPPIAYGLAIRPEARPLPILAVFEEFLRSCMAGVQEQLLALPNA